MTRHERFDTPLFVHRYEVDTLGAPFKVIAVDCVTRKADPATGQVLTTIPDLVGLINAVVRSRVTHPRKLNGAEIKFVRNALGIKASLVTKFFEISPEHLSRCEAGTKVMSSSTERVFRLMMYVATFHSNPEELLLEALKGGDISEDINKRVKKPDEVGKKFMEQFLTMKIEAAYDAAEELCFEFTRESYDDPTNSARPEDDEAEWEPRHACCG